MSKRLKFLFITTLTTLMVLAGSILQVGEPLMAANSVNPVALANQLYIQYPDIPKVAHVNTTLLSRFIDYHLDGNARPGQYHLDWELSLADYLGATYGHHGHASDSITVADKHAMKTLSLDQRHQLVSSLEQLFAE
ncbi:MAG: hypothetical protein AAF821_01245 [Cyanobacteria bacterium P01_D01_bin.156]